MPTLARLFLCDSLGCEVGLPTVSRHEVSDVQVHPFVPLPPPTLAVGQLAVSRHEVSTLQVYRPHPCLSSGPVRVNVDTDTNPRADIQ